MALPLPTSLSPSKVSTFKDCALAFRFSAIDRLPEPPSVPAVKGTLVHRALELLFCADAAERRTPERATSACLEARRRAAATPRSSSGSSSTTARAPAFVADAAVMVERYFELEDPTPIRPIGLELMLEAEVGDLRLRGIIDRLELDADGELVVTDYKTGRRPRENQEQSRLGGVHFYAFLCEQLFGKRPAQVQLVYLGARPAGHHRHPDRAVDPGPREARSGAIWTAVERACEHEDFRPKPSALCNWCSFKAYCPAFGGDPDEAGADRRRSRRGARRR